MQAILYDRRDYRRAGLFCSLIAGAILGDGVAIESLWLCWLAPIARCRQLTISKVETFAAAASGPRGGAVAAIAADLRSYIQKRGHSCHNPRREKS
jgi:hypothetical protein